MGALMSISLIVGGIGIMNVLLSSVIERTREIGIRKATGAAQRHILWQFLCESVAITGVGSMIGLVIGVGAAFGITAIMRRVANAPIQAWLSLSTVLGRDRCVGSGRAGVRALSRRCGRLASHRSTRFITSRSTGVPLRLRSHSGG